MKEAWRFLKGFSGSVVWVFAVLIVGMVFLRWVRNRNVTGLSTAASDVQNLAKTGSISGN